MKKTSLFIFFLLLLFLLQKATGQIKYGVHGGFNISSISPQLAEAQGNLAFAYTVSKPREGFYVGAFGDFKLNTFLNLVVACDYTQNRYKIFETLHAPGGGYDRTVFTRLNLLELHGLILYGLPLGEGKISIGAGGGACYTLAGKNKKISVSVFGTTISYPEFEPNKIIPAAAGILKYEFNSGLFFEIMYDYLINAQDDINLSVFEIGGGFAFRFKKKRK